MASITSMGIGSGLDISSIISQLVAAEGGPTKARLNRQEKEASTELSALGTLKSALSSLKSSFGKVGQASTFEPTKASSSDEERLKVSAGKDAPAGEFSVEVLRLAQRHKLGSDTFEPTATFGGTAGDKLELTIGEETLSLDLSTAKTLGEIRDAINGAENNPGISATVVRIDDSQEVLMLTAAETGEANAIGVSETLAGGSSLSFDTANLDGSGQPLADLAALDAAVRIDGVEVTRSSDRLSDVIDDVTLDLLQAEAGTQVRVSVAPDHGAVAEAISSLVGQYNGFMAALDSVSGYRGEGAEQPPLFADALTRGLANRLRSELGRVIEGPDSPFSTLSEIGITFGDNGKLELDRGALDKALAQDRAAVGELFHGEQGLASRMDELIGSYLQKGGIFEARTEGLNGRLDRIDDSRETLDRRLAALEDRYKQQFLAMDTLVSQLNTTSSYLAQQLANLNSFRL